MNNSSPFKLIASWENETSMVGNVSQLLRQNLTAKVDEGVPRGTLKLWFAVFISICMLGVLNNILLLIIISGTKKLRSGTGILILHLLVACLLMCVIHYPILGILIYGNNYWFANPKQTITSHVSK
ncbi:hypothetical protein BV898_18838 [Hypsibius exemplaris]|uniref:G-protein coupled receptors family 1 profile domain-containing protein n=1 Tax=Hypsibius exemplaris TaxID=2072580 RepID=A0A9X6NJK4_HYPEX|nr:hypothetical protein BV898_18838 [Hypsibius exemplaris]